LYKYKYTVTDSPVIFTAACTISDKYMGEFWEFPSLHDVEPYNWIYALNFNGGENFSEELLDFTTLDEATIKPSHNVVQQSHTDAARRPKMTETSVTASCIQSTAAFRPPTQNPIQRIAVGLAPESKGRQTTEFNNARSHASTHPFCTVNSLLNYRYTYY
jgi:hypothetical protein